MAIKILMPALSPTMETGTLSNWQKKEGDMVSSGDVLADIETDKATMEVEAVDEGILGKIIVPAGTEGVKINSVIAVLLEEGESADVIDSMDLSVVVTNSGNSGANPTPTPAPKVAPQAQPAPASQPAPAPQVAPATSNQRIFATPLARRLAKEYGVDLSRLKGSSAHGRITRSDVESAKSGTGASGAISSANYQQTDLSPMPEYDSIKPDNIRKVIARRLTQSKQEIPHFYLSSKADITQLTILRAQYNSRFEDKAQKISINDLVIKASALALMDVPDANASWIGAGEEIRRYNRADISVAVASPKGLITPIIRDADNKPIGLIGAEVKALVGKARAGTLQPLEYEGGTFSISNMGMFGIDEFKAIINPPQACILAVGQAVKTPTYDANDNIVPATLLSLSLSVDHRVVDGAVAAEYMAALQKHLQNPLWLFL